MGVTTDAILVFGVEIGEEDEPPAFMEDWSSDIEDLDDFLMHEGGQARYGDEDHSWDAEKAYLATMPVDMTWHCSGNYPMWILAVRGTEITANRGSPVELDALPEVDPAKIEAFQKWASDHGIDASEPKWLLCSYWGQ